MVIATPEGQVIELGGGAAAYHEQQDGADGARLKALNAIRDVDGAVTVHTDSSYVIKGIS